MRDHLAIGLLAASCSIRDCWAQSGERLPTQLVQEASANPPASPSDLDHGGWVYSEAGEDGLRFARASLQNRGNALRRNGPIGAQLIKRQKRVRVVSFHGWQSRDVSGYTGVRRPSDEAHCNLVGVGIYNR